MGKRLLSAFALDEPERFAQLLGNSHDVEEAVEILEGIPDGSEADVLAHLKPEAAERLLNSLPLEMLANWLSTCPSDSGRRLLNRLGTERAHKLIDKIKDPARRRGLRRMATWPAGTIGSQMHDSLLVIPETATAEEVSERYRDLQGERVGLAIILNDKERVVGVLDMSAIVANADPAAHAEEFCLQVRPVYAESPLESLLDPEVWQGRHRLPVVDFQDRLVGYISRSDVAASLGLSSPGSLFVESAVELSSRYMQFLAFVLTMIVSRRKEP